jgi:hypothetical protein
MVTLILWIALFYLMNLTFGFLKDILSNKCNDTDVCIHVCTDLYQYMLCYSIGNVWNMTVVMIDSCDCGHCRRPWVQWWHEMECLKETSLYIMFTTNFEKNNCCCILDYWIDWSFKGFIKTLGQRKSAVALTSFFLKNMWRQIILVCKITNYSEEFGRKLSDFAPGYNISYCSICHFTKQSFLHCN